MKKRNNLKFFSLTFFIQLSSFAADSYQIVSGGGSQSITEWGICVTVTNNKTSDLFVPTKTASELTAFLSVSTTAVVKDIKACSCRSLLAMGNLVSGTYSIDPDDSGPVASMNVYCDMSTSGGGWTLIAKSAVSGTITGTGFGWMSSTGTVSDDSNCYSMNVSAAGLQFSEILFGENSTAKSWGTYTYKRNFSNTDIVTYSASQPAARNPTLVLGTNPYNFSMARLVGFTANTTNYLFRDVVGNHPAIGLQCHTWNAVYADDTPSNGYNGYMHLRQGMLFVR